jgi:transposase-like protein
MNRKIWTTEEKLGIVIEMLKGGDSVTEICHRHQVSSTQAYGWRGQFLEGGKKACGSLERGAKHMAVDKLIKEQGLNQKQALRAVGLARSSYHYQSRKRRGAYGFDPDLHEFCVLRLEYAGIQCPDDKPYIEAILSKYKTEEVYRNEYWNIAGAKAGWELYRSWHENERIHQTLNYQTPKQVRESQKITLVSRCRICTDEPKTCNINQALLCPK